MQYTSFYCTVAYLLNVIQSTVFNPTALQKKTFKKIKRENLIPTTTTKNVDEIRGGVRKICYRK